MACLTVLTSNVREYLSLHSEDRMLRAKVRAATKRMDPEPFEPPTPIVKVVEAAALANGRCCTRSPVGITDS